MLTASDVRFAADRQRRWLPKAGFITAGILAILTFGPRIEERLFPVLAGYQLADRDVAADGSLIFSGRYLKERDCKYLSRTWYGVMADGMLERVVYARTIYPPAEGAVTRPTGWNESLAMRVMPPPGSQRLYGEFTFACPMMPWTSVARVGPFDIWTNKGG